MTIGRSADNPIPPGLGGVMLGNSLIRAYLRGDTYAMAVSVVSLVNQTGRASNAAAESTITALTIAAATSLIARFGRDGALAYLDGLDEQVQFDAVVKDIDGA